MRTASSLALIAAGYLVVALAVPATSHAGESPARRARAVLENQLAWVDDPRAFLATLAPDTLITGNGRFTLASGTNAASIVATLATSARIEAPVASVELTRVDVGGTDDLAWISADVAIVRAPAPLANRVVLGGPEPDEPAFDVITLRIVELITWDGPRSKVVALSFSSSAGATAAGDVLGKPRAGPLSRLLASPLELHGARWDDAATLIIGYTPVRVGPVAVRRGLEKWRHRDAKVQGAVEIDGGAWRVCVGDVLIAGVRMQVMLLAIPATRGWKLVAAHVIDSPTAVAPVELDP